MALTVEPIVEFFNCAVNELLNFLTMCLESGFHQDAMRMVCTVLLVAANVDRVTITTLFAPLLSTLGVFSCDQVLQVVVRADEAG